MHDGVGIGNQYRIRSQPQRQLRRESERRAKRVLVASYSPTEQITSSVGLGGCPVQLPEIVPPLGQKVRLASWGGVQGVLDQVPSRWEVENATSRASPEKVTDRRPKVLDRRPPWIREVVDIQELRAKGHRLLPSALRVTRWRRPPA